MIFTTPNILSFIRLLLAPMVLVLYLEGEYRAAVLLFAIASFTDLLDGLLARLLHQKSKLGAVLDPLADKVLGVAAIVALTIERRLPVWFLVVVLLRDAVVLVIVAGARLRGVRIAATPSRVSKSATFFVNVAVIVALIHQIAYASELSPYVVSLTLVAGECVAVAALQYLVRFAPVLWTASPAPSGRSP